MRLAATQEIGGSTPPRFSRRQAAGTTLSTGRV